jgi:Caspase domain
MCRLVVLLTAATIALLTSDLARANPAYDGPKKVALLVGVNRYKTRILVDKPLEFAERDVEGLAEVPKAQGFEVRTLVGDSATKQGIDAALDLVLKGREASDLVLLAFAGHGVQMPLVDAEGKPVLDARGKPLGDAYF